MKLVLVTGLSGAGKTQALKVLEDIGFYCVDNLPPVMIPSFVGLCAENPDIKEAAIAVDIRGGLFIDGIGEALRSLDRNRIDFDILFLEASESVIIKRYKETRRVHPLEKKHSIADCVKIENQVLAPLRERATQIIDTSFMQTKELWQNILDIYRPEETAKDVTVNILSFGYKNGLPPEADLVFDARFLPNPFYNPEMRDKSGLDKIVYNYVASFRETTEFLRMLTELLSFVLPFYLREGNKYPTIGIGCTGGRHRSVAITLMLEEILTAKGYRVAIRHKDINVDAKR